MPVSRKKIGHGLVLAIVIAGVFAFFYNQQNYENFIEAAGTTSTSTHSVSVGNSTPVISGITINQGNPIVLVGGATQTVSISFSISDNNGCGDVLFGGGVTTTLYRSGVGGSCSQSNNSCYISAVVSTHTCPFATSTQISANVTTSLDLYYYADATDASSSYSAQNWLAEIDINDASSSINSTTSPTGVELNTLVALEVNPTSSSYGSLSAGSTTASNTIELVHNAGNSSTTLQLSGTALTSGVNSIPTSSQHYATSTFTYGGTEQLLQQTATAVSGFLLSMGSAGLIYAPPVTWRQTTVLPSAMSDITATSYNGYIYVPGAGTDTTTVRFSHISATGSLETWATTTPLPIALNHPRAVAYNGYIYQIGGVDTGLNNTSSVRFAPINSTGSIGAWTNTTALPNDLDGHGAIAYNGYLYVFGGETNASFVPTATVRFAPINSTGSIGAWATTSPLVGGLDSMGVALSGNTVYIAGGLTIDNSTGTTTVKFATINSTGSLSAWTNTTILPASSSEIGLGVVGSYIYLFGGRNPFNGTALSNVYYASINSTGSIGTWTAGTSLASVIRSFAQAVESNNLYRIGGHNGSFSTSSVEVGTLATSSSGSASSSNIYWGLQVPSSTTPGSYSGTVTYTAVFSP